MRGLGVKDGAIASSLYIYSTKHMNGSEKVKFHYSLKGRNKPGILEEINARHIASTVVVVPRSRETELEVFFNKWSIPFTKELIYTNNLKEDIKKKIIGK